ncbi:MAG: aminotransferase class V-fold PLP-dependent enzyme [Candidatus Micrarchaeia archaeon]
MKCNFKEDFPLIRKLHYLDNAATSLKPRQVLSQMNEYYLEYCANTHRGIYRISERATEMYERTRDKAAKWFGCKPAEVIFTRNTTESLNQLANALQLRRGDTVLLTAMEHHSNIVPWLMLKERRGIRVEYIPLAGTQLDYPAFEEMVSTLRPKVLSFVHASNVLGTINNSRYLARVAHDAGATVIADCAQSAPHERINFRSMGADYVALSAHKMLGPTGVGLLIGREGALESLPPFFGGGGMIRSVSEQSFTTAEVPQKFEAGTPNIAGVIGFGASLDYLKMIGRQRISSTSRMLLKYALKRAHEYDCMRIYSNTDPKSSVGILTFAIPGVHPHDISALLDSVNVCIRAGHHCAQPLHKRLGVEHTARASFYVYNTKEDVDALFEGIARVRRVFGV